MSYRKATRSEIISAFYKLENIEQWEKLHAFVLGVWGKEADHVEVSVESEYNDEGYDDVISDIIVTDAEDNALIPDWKNIPVKILMMDWDIEHDVIGGETVQQAMNNRLRGSGMNNEFILSIAHSYGIQPMYGSFDMGHSNEPEPIFYVSEPDRDGLDKLFS